MLLARCITRRPLGVFRPSGFRAVNADCNGVVAVLVLNRGAGGAPGKRRKFRGDFKASKQHIDYSTAVSTAVVAANLQSPSGSSACLDYFCCVGGICVAFGLDVLHSMAKQRGAKFKVQTSGGWMQSSCRLHTGRRAEPTLHSL